ncbi:MAG: peptidylprolyl isomerase [Armatimonadota bacterium]
MSIVRMRKVFRGRVKMKMGKKILDLPSPAEGIFYLIIVIFVAGAYTMFGGPGRGGGQKQQTTDQGKVTPVVATVDGEKITRQLYDTNLQMRLQSMSEPDVTQERYVRSGTLSALIDAIVTRKAIRKEGVKVTGADLTAEKDKQVEQIVSQRFPEKRMLVHFLKKENKTLDQFKRGLREEAFKDPDALRDQVGRDKLQQLIESKVTVSDADLTASYNEVQASHILISSKKLAEKAQEATKAGQPAQPVDGDALAKKKAEDLLAQIKAGADFAKLARENSDDPGSATKGGDLGFFKKGMMVPEFDTAVFSLKPGEVTPTPIKTDFGYHIIKVIAARQSLPKDFDKNKETYRSQALQDKKSKAWAEYQKQLIKDAKTEIVDPELEAYRLLDDGKLAEGAQKLAQAVEMNPKNVVACWELGKLYDEKKDLPNAIKMFELVTATEDGARNPMVHLKLGDLYLAQANKAKALSSYTNATDRASGFTMQNFSVNMQVEQKLKTLGDAAGAAKVTQWLADFRKDQQNNPMGGMGGMGGPMGNFQMPPQ